MNINMTRNHRISLMASILAIAVCFGYVGSALAQAPADPTNATLAFDKLKTLVGHWESTSDKGTGSTTYQLVSGGTVLLEHTNMPGEQEMITAYYVDGDRLLLTHYCEVGNQPRMQAATFDAAANILDFHFLDATNLQNPASGHMHNVVIKFHSSSEIAEDWTFYKDGKPGFTVPVLYHRVN
jgi:hypothetical protein